MTVTNSPQHRRIQATPFTPSAAIRKQSGYKFKPVHGIIGLVFAAALTIAWYLIAARSLVVTVMPEDAEVAINEGMSFRIADNFLLLPGDYRLSIEHSDYYPYSEPLAITDDKLQTTTIGLQPLPGDVLFSTRPQATAEIFIDGEPVANTTGLVREIAAGEREYLLRFSRYQDISGSLEVTGLRRQQEVSLELVPAWAEITIATEPPGAEIWVDDELIGQTPATVELLAGERNILLQKADYKSLLYPLLVKAQEPQDLGLLDLAKIDGLLAISSKPSGASVTINGTYVGQTPIDAPVTPGENLNVYLFKEGFQAVSRQTDVASGESKQMELTLAAVLGEVTIKANPADALLYIDGRLSGRANQTVTLPAKQHQVKVTKEGYVDFTTTVIPRVGLAQYINPKLATEEEAKWAQTPPVITTKVGQRLQLFKPSGVFTSGASRREQGRRANEVQRKIELTRPFYLANFETTNAQFKQFLSDHSSSHVSGLSLNGEQQPVVNISWEQAALFCNWLSAQENLPAFYRVENGKIVGFDAQAIGYRLPTEAEWIWAARFTSGEMLKYSWGRALPPPEKSANIGDRAAASLLGTIQTNYDDGHAITSPVGSFKANHNGLFDISGNAAEWVNDYYFIKTGMSTAVETDPLGPEEGDYHVIRGSSWASGGITDLRLSYRDYGRDPKNTIGFRIARYVE